ncbi:hypothetical protein [Variovorax saccharolyticus]|uniref:hypothetical protein n=1 Tax=Variovorax saccharolyticus TaxID=3053516 RepID=UPI002576AB7D|nr:hypothetical protein [Variovorax sp. J31P216]MDM0026498.1 hypothetical protein [Variovorax sp. J31P216]
MNTNSTVALYPPRASAPKRVPVRYFALLLGFLEARGMDTARLLELASVEAGRLELSDATLLLADTRAFRRHTGKTPSEYQQDLMRH